MSFRKPFRAQPVKLGPYWRAEQRWKRWRIVLRQAGIILLVGVLVFLLGMAVTNWAALKAWMPAYYDNCRMARLDGASSIRRGERGYRSDLDADGDGIACEPYRKPDGTWVTA